MTAYEVLGRQLRITHRTHILDIKISRCKKPARARLVRPEQRLGAVRPAHQQPAAAQCHHLAHHRRRALCERRQGHPVRGAAGRRRGAAAPRACPVRVSRPRPPVGRRRGAAGAALAGGLPAGRGLGAERRDGGERGGGGGRRRALPVQHDVGDLEGEVRVRLGARRSRLASGRAQLPQAPLCDDRLPAPGGGAPNCRGAHAAPKASTHTKP